MSALLSDARPEHTSATARTTRQGQVLGGTYRLLERIGAGGMGDVYAAEHTRLSRQFAVKILRASEEPKGLDRFHREVKAIARIENEYVVNVMDCGKADDGTPYLVMDLLRGEDLRCLLARDAPLPIPRAVHLIWEASQGVAAVHDAGLIHRDLKPGNLFVARRSTGEDWCKVLDFGVAKIDTSIWTAEGSVVGTVKYMAPEQLRDGASAGPSVDIYALGVILYECLSGAPPHSSTSLQELMFKTMNEDPTPLHERRREVPAALCHAVLRAMAKAPSERFATVQDFARAIAPFARGAAHGESSPQLDTVSHERRLVEGPLPRAWRRRTTAFVSGLVLGASVFAAIDVLRGGAVGNASTAPRASAPLAVQPPSLVPPHLAPSLPASIEPAPPAAAIIPPTSAAGASSARHKLPPAPSHALSPAAAPLPLAKSLANATFDPDNPYLH